MDPNQIGNLLENIARNLAPISPGLAPGDIWRYFANLISWLLLAGGILAFFGLIISGFQYITAAGDQEKVARAKQNLFSTILGIIIISISYTIVAYIKSIL